jgi:hypothetical protein
MQIVLHRNSGRLPPDLRSITANSNRLLFTAAAQRKIAETMRMLRNAAVCLLALWLVFVGVIYYEMSRPPLHFASFIAKMPELMFLVLPFETLWMRARGGSLHVGSDAPDFHLKTLDGKAEVALSAFRGARPVVLVFGSYT